MLYVLCAVAVMALILGVSEYRRWKSCRRRRHCEPVRVFTPDMDPFDPNERIEFFFSRRNNDD